MEEHQGPSKYSARVDKSDLNTSHGLVLDLVGSGKRVLDVGCASGYLAEALVAQDNKVSGVEIDPVAAEAARKFLDRLVVGNVEQLDLVEEFGPGEFDVVVFADVLEHLTDPVKVLRRSRPLLAEGGYAVLSIPNVAHGSVRLSLLAGRFDYRPIGLLDDTHLRFFTRATFDELLAEAGFVAVDMRQTSAGPFDTEIPVERTDFRDEVVDEVEGDPESYVYQFVARAEPVDGPGGALGPLIVRRNRELHQLRRTLHEIARRAAGGPAAPSVAVIEASAGEPPAVRALRAELVRLELRRRLAGFDVQALSLGSGAAVTGLTADPVEPIDAWDEGAVADLQSRFDAVVVISGVLGPPRSVISDLEDADTAVHQMVVDGSLQGTPDPLVLAPRLVGGDIPHQRLLYLRVLGTVPEAGPYAVGRPGAATVGGMPAVAVPSDASSLDLVGLVAGAQVVVSDDPAVTALATGMGRPMAAPGEDGRAAPGPGEVESHRSLLAGRADIVFDQISRAVALDAGQKLASTVPQRLAQMDRRIRLLETVNTGLQVALARERLAMAAELQRARAGTGDPTQGPERSGPGRIQRLEAEVQRLAAENARLQAEIDRIYATRTMRAVAPVRRVYGRLRTERP